MQTKRGSSSWFLSLVLKHPRLQLSVNTTQHIISGICSNYHQKVSSASETHLNYKNGFWINMLQVIWSKIFFFNPKQPKINNNPPLPNHSLLRLPLESSWTAECPQVSAAALELPLPALPTDSTSWGSSAHPEMGRLSRCATLGR